MAGFFTVVQALPFVQQGVSLYTGALGSELGYHDSRASQAQALSELQTRQDQQLQNLEQQAALERQSIAADAAESERKRRTALKKAVSRQRANFGASGLGASGGSSGEAVLLGLFQESEAERVERENSDNLRLSSIDQSLYNQRRLNLIQRTQLLERQRIGDASRGLDRFNSLFDFGVGALRFGARPF